MILLADSGSTKVDWRAIKDDGTVVAINTVGVNPVFVAKDKIIEIFKNELVPVIGNGVDEVYFYGAGVVGDDIINTLDECFKAVFPKSHCFCASDVLAAARALCGHKPGVACIIGTGSNSCLYDGKDIAKNVKAGGFILGDEASGGYLGKRLVSDFIKGLLPKHIEEEFVKRYDLDYPKIVAKVYREPVPSRFLASFSPFIFEFKDDPHIHALLIDSFSQFMTRNVYHYDYKNLEVNFVGSIAYYYQDILKEVAAGLGVKVGKILKAPIEGLIEYHKC